MNRNEKIWPRNIFEIYSPFLIEKEFFVQKIPKLNDLVETLWVRNYVSPTIPTIIVEIIEYIYSNKSG